MKFLILLSLSLLLVNCENLRGLMLTMEPEIFKKLTEAATKAIHQIYNLTLDFGDRIQEGIEDDKKKIQVTVYDNPIIPTANEQLQFNITNGKVSIPSVLNLKHRLNLFGKAYNLYDEMEILGTMIANTFKNGYVIVYHRDSEKGVVAHSRFRCFVQENGEDYGAFEVVQVDKNDSKTIKEKITLFLEILGVVNKGVKGAAELISTIKGIQQDVKSSSSFLKIPLLMLLIIFGLL